MTVIRIFVNGNDDVLGFRVSGHAGAGTEGNDVVCAAISAVAYTILGSLEQLAKVDISSAKISDGYMEFRLSGDYPEGTPDVVSCIFATMEVGFQQIVGSYGQYARIEYEEV